MDDKMRNDMVRRLKVIASQGDDQIHTVRALAWDAISMLENPLADLVSQPAKCTECVKLRKRIQDQHEANMTEGRKVALDWLNMLVKRLETVPWSDDHKEIHDTIRQALQGRVEHVTSDEIKNRKTKGPIKMNDTCDEALKLLPNEIWVEADGYWHTPSITGRKEILYVRKDTIPASGWQDISSAHKDWSSILLYIPELLNEEDEFYDDAEVTMGYYSCWDGGLDCWLNMRGKIIRPTHWLPLPAPPGQQPLPQTAKHEAAAWKALGGEDA